MEDDIKDSIARKNRVHEIIRKRRKNLKTQNPLKNSFRSVHFLNSVSRAGA